MTEKTYADGLNEAAQIAADVSAAAMARSVEYQKSDDRVDIEYSVVFHRKARTALEIEKLIRSRIAEHAD